MPHFPPILCPSSCSSVSFTLLAQWSKDSERTFSLWSIPNNSSRVYLYLPCHTHTRR